MQHEPMADTPYDWRYLERLTEEINRRGRDEPPAPWTDDWRREAEACMDQLRDLIRLGAFELQPVIHAIKAWIERFDADPARFGYPVPFQSYRGRFRVLKRQAEYCYGLFREDLEGPLRTEGVRGGTPLSD